MSKIYLVIGYDYGYVNIYKAFKNKKAAKKLENALNINSSDYIFDIKEVDLVEQLKINKEEIKIIIRWGTLTEGEYGFDLWGEWKLLDRLKNEDQL